MALAAGCRRRVPGRAGLLFGLLAGVLATSPAAAWWGDGHGILTRAAVLAQPQSVPAFFRDGGDWVAHVSYDPDLAKNRAAPHLYDHEHSEHYVDLELLEGAPLPSTRHAFIALCDSLGVSPSKVGYVPYAIAETTELLAIAFAEHRKWPDNPVIQAKAKIYAGWLAHYAEDLAQPLHATVDFDGRPGPDGEKVHRGIHEKVDAIVERLEIDPAALARQVDVAPIEGDLFAAIAAQARESNERVDAVYAVAGGLEDPVSAEARALAQERARRAVTFTASLFLTAWELSEQVRLEGWLTR